MSEPTNQDLKDLILALDKKFEIGFTQLKGEIKSVEERLSRDMKCLEEKLSGEINRVEEKLSGEINRVEEKLGGEIKRVEEKLSGEINRVEARLDGLDKRLGNEEFISRTAFTAVVVGMLSGVVKYLFFSV